MNTLLIILAFICVLVGIVATFTPVPPAVPVAWLGLLLARLGGVAVGTGTLVWAAVVGVLLMVLDYVLPVVTTRKFGGSKWGVWGCTIGLLLGVVGLPLGPGGIAGLFFWPFVGALVGEYLKQRDTRIALRAAVGSFIGMMTGIVAKVAYGVVLLAIIIVKLF